MSGPPGAAPPADPVLRVLGGASAEEVAALVTVLAAVAARTSAAAAWPTAVSRWASRADAVRVRPPVGPDAWRTSAWPHRG